MPRHYSENLNEWVSFLRENNTTLDDSTKKCYIENCNYDAQYRKIIYNETSNEDCFIGLCELHKDI